MRARSSADARVAEIAGRQHGVITLAQLRGAGLTIDQVRSRVARGFLHRIHRGVFVVGHPRLSGEGRWMAGVLAGGRGAVTCSWSAGARWEIADDDRREVHIAVDRRLRSRPGLRFHSRALSAAMVTSRRGIPVLSPADTLVDLASVMTPDRLQRAVHEAEVRRLCRPPQLWAALERRPGARGIGALREILDMAEGRSLSTRSELEDRFLRFLKRHELPLPRTNARVPTPRGSYEVDCLWESARLVVELDGAKYHSGHYAQRRDARKDRALKAVGLDVNHVTWRDLAEDEDELLGDLRPLIIRLCS